MKPFALEGDVAVVTGAASGIGREIAKTFAREGAAVACFDKNVQGLASVTAEIETAGGRRFPWRSTFRILHRSTLPCGRSLRPLAS